MECRGLNADRLGAPIFRCARFLFSGQQEVFDMETGREYMGYFSPKEMIGRYAAAGSAKCALSTSRLLLLGVLAGLFIAMGCAVTSTAAFDLQSVSMARTVSGLLFPLGLCMVIVTGAELFTGNNLLVISLLEKQCTLKGMLRNWALAYAGNFAGALLLAAGCVYCGQIRHGAGALAVYTVKLAVNKCSMDFLSAFGMGAFCNLLVCTAVLMAMSAKDGAGRLLGAFVPICCFITCGFEHSVANMYYIAAGMMTAGVPEYAAAAQNAGLDLSVLTVGNFLLGNLLPVTLGNLAGGAGVGAALWFCHGKK